MRDYHGRGIRGPVLSGVPAQRTRAELFDHLALVITDGLAEMWADHIGEVELAVEEVPVLPEHWSSSTVPMSTWIPGRGRAPSRLVLFRRPIERRAKSRIELESMLLTVVVQQFADVLGLPAEYIDPLHPD